jgi:hypothetical protein
VAGAADAAGGEDAERLGPSREHDIVSFLTFSVRAVEDALIRFGGQAAPELTAQEDADPAL